MKMNKLVVACLITASVGVLISGIGFAFGGRVYGFSLGSDGLSVASNQETQGNSKFKLEEKNMELEEFTDLKMDIVFAEVNIVESDHFGLEYCVREDMYLEESIENGKLTIKQHSPNADFSLFSIGTIQMGNNKEHEFVTLFIPKGTKLGTAELYNDSGNINADTLNADKIIVTNSFGHFKADCVNTNSIEMQMDSGKIDIAQLTTEELNITDSFGSVSIDNLSVTNGEMNLDSGNLNCQSVSAKTLVLNLSFGKVDIDDMSVDSLTANLDSGNFTVKRIQPTALTVNSLFGDVELGLVGTTDDYQINADTDFGSIKVNREDMKTKYVNGNKNSDRVCTISCDSGSVKLYDVE